MAKRMGKRTGGVYFVWALGGLMAIIGLALATGGGYLVAVGGSRYFLLMGLAMTLAAVLILCRRPAGAWLYGLAFLLTLCWAVWEVGLSFWPLFSRLFMFGVLALLVTLAYPQLSARRGEAGSRRGGYGLAALLTICLAGGLGYTFVPTPLVSARQAVAVLPVAPGAEQKNWLHWGNTTAGDRFAALDQITKANVGQLQVAWIAHTGDIPHSLGAGAEDQNTPLQVGDMLYVCTAYGKVLALEGDSGTVRWRFDPKAHAPNWQRCRGLGYYADEAVPARDAAAPAPIAAPRGLHVLAKAGKPPPDAAPLSAAKAAPAGCARRLFLPTIDARLIALDADTGQPCADFGDGGSVDLTIDMGEVKPGYYQQTSAPLVAGDRVVVGGRVADNFATGEPPGVVRAFDVHSGALVWAWDPGNPAITRAPPPGATYTRGTPNVWSAMSFDPQLNLIYLPTGNATPDFFGGKRTALDDKYSSSVVAVDAATGQVRWHFQTTHHDLWDFDLPSQPLLYDLPNGDGTATPVLVQTTKQGMIFMLNRATGEPVAKVEERTVPQGNTPGERYAPSQPFSVGMPNIGNAMLTEADMWGATPLDQLLCRIAFNSMRHQGIYTPPGAGSLAAVSGVAGRHELGQRSAGSAQCHYLRQRYAPGSGKCSGRTRPRAAGGQRDRNGAGAAGRHPLWRGARAFSVAARYPLSKTAVRHDVGGGSALR